MKLHSSAHRPAAGPVFRFVAPALALLVLSGCGGSQPWQPPSTQDTRDNPAKVRPRHCNAGLGFWAPLAAPEAGALRNLARAKANDPDALLALALFASNARRDAASYERYRAAIAKFVEQVRPRVDAAPDEWHRGYELHRAMHRVFFGNRQGLQNYDFHQSRVTGILETKKYNCISSAMLFAVLAAAFEMPVRGVEVPTHAFVELGPPDGKVLEVETTTDTGFDWVHDQRFYRDAAKEWSSSRGLAPVTFEQYQNRRILEPYQLMALGMLNQAGLEQSETDRNRLMEAAAFVDERSADAALHRTQSWVNETVHLTNAQAFRTTVKFFDCVGRPLEETARAWKGHPEIPELAAWAEASHANALGVVGRGDEAVEVAERGMASLNSRWKDAAAIRQNLFNVLMDEMLVKTSDKDYAGATAVVKNRISDCRAYAPCTQNLEFVYQNWYLDHYNAGNWQRAREVMKKCLAQLPNSTLCGETLADLESQHRF